METMQNSPTTNADNNRKKVLINIYKHHFSAKQMHRQKTSVNLIIAKSHANSTNAQNGKYLIIFTEYMEAKEGSHHPLNARYLYRGMKTDKKWTKTKMDGIGKDGHGNTATKTDPIPLVVELEMTDKMVQ